jgi:hypothetical protein
MKKRLAWILAMLFFVLSFGSPVFAEGEDSLCPGGPCENSYECQQIVYCTLCDRLAPEKVCIE